ncbi:MAG TPA: hypothetical protein VNV88_07985 [Candidatus Solibacter sp.]|nr:hypothetical protein [Candidatus Solibacter sp.]
MTLRAAIILLALSCTAMLGTARQQPNASSTGQPAARNQAKATGGDAQSQNDSSQNDQTGNDQTRNDQTQALRGDLTRMRALVQQMEENLAFVDTTQSPLKHQFELEIDMWRTMITQMERRLQPRSHANQVK